MTRARKTGCIEHRNGKDWVRLSLPDDTRPRYVIPPEIPPEEWDRYAAEIDKRERARVEKAMAEARAPRPTVKVFGERWTSGELYRMHGEVRRLRVKATAQDDADRLEVYVYPVIGSMAVADVTELDIERVLAEAPARFSKRNKGRDIRPATRRHIFQVMRRLFGLAIRPGRLIERTPVGEDVKPVVPKHDLLFGYLYPPELLQVLARREIPIGRRVLYALATYTGLRLGSLKPIRWSATDLVHGTIASVKSKTGVVQMFDLQPSLTALLVAWFEHLGRPELDTTIVRDTQIGSKKEAPTLRQDLLDAGCKRRELVGEGVLEPLRFHDLRATFVTWAMREGRGLHWIMDRTGHLGVDQVERYSRAARTLADLKIEPFPDLTAAIPEFTKLPANVHRLPRRRNERRARE